MKISDFRLKSPFISETVRQANDCYGTLIWSYRQPIHSCRFRWPLVTLNGWTPGVKFWLWLAKFDACRVLTIKPLYQAFICGLVKLVLSMRNVMSSLESFLLLELPMSPGTLLHSNRSYSSTPRPFRCRCDFALRGNENIHNVCRRINGNGGSAKSNQCVTKAAAAAAADLQRWARCLRASKHRGW